MQSSNVLDSSKKHPMISDEFNKKHSVSLSSSEKPEPSLSKDRIASHNPIFVLATGVASAAFWVLAAGVCPSTANDGDINKTQCGVGVTSGLVFLLVGGLAAFGLIHFDKREIDGDMARLLDVPDSINGYTVSKQPAGADLGNPCSIGLD